MLKILIIFIATMIISLAVMLLSALISKKHFQDREKSSPFECGFDPFSPSRLPFSLRFFMISIIFLIFDIEIALILPLPLTFASLNPAAWFSIMWIFITTLLLGLFHEWNQGALEWAN